jgi:hypothetical protein
VKTIVIVACVLVLLSSGRVVPASAEPPRNRGKMEEAFPANLSIAMASPVWSRCGGSSDNSDLKALIPVLVCYGKTDARSAEVASLALDGLGVKGMEIDQDMAWETNTDFAVMQVYSGINRNKALDRDEYVLASMKVAGGPLPDDNCDARPAQWKSNGPHVDLWVYKSGGAIVQTYVFTNNKLTQTLKP